MKIKTIKKHRAGQTIKTSIGNISFDNKCEAEIPDEDFSKWKSALHDIVESGSAEDLKASESVVGVKKSSLIMESGEVLVKEKPVEVVGGSEAEEQPNAELPEISREELKELSVVDLKELALKVSGVDVDLVNKMKKKDDLIDILISNQNNARA